MPNLLITAILAATTPTTTASKKSGGSSTIFLVILVAFVGVYFFFLRPRQQKAKAQRTGAGKTLAVGDEVVTIGGILGTVSAVDADSVTVEVSSGTHMSFLRRAVNLRTAVAGAPRSNPVAESDEADEAEYDAEDEDDSWEDEDAAAEEPVGHPSDLPGAGSTAAGSTAAGSTAAGSTAAGSAARGDGDPDETGDGSDNDRGGRGGGRRR